MAAPGNLYERSANARFVDDKMRKDPAYAPYCLNGGCDRMTRVAPDKAECRKCGAAHVVPPSQPLPPNEDA